MRFRCCGKPKTYLLRHEAAVLTEELTLGGHVAQSRAPQPVLLQWIQLHPLEQGLVAAGGSVNR